MWAALGVKTVRPDGSHRDAQVGMGDWCGIGSSDSVKTSATGGKQEPCKTRSDSISHEKTMVLPRSTQRFYEIHWGIISFPPRSLRSLRWNSFVADVAK